MSSRVDTRENEAEQQCMYHGKRASRPGFAIQVEKTTNLDFFHFRVRCLFLSPLLYNTKHNQTKNHSRTRQREDHSGGLVGAS